MSSALGSVLALVLTAGASSSWLIPLPLGAVRNSESCCQMAARGNTKTITVSFPVELAEQAEHLAKTESRTMSELFREAFRTYRMEAVRRRLEAGKAYAQSRSAHGYTETDVERLVDEARAELRAGRRKRR